jgi:hypothetical protein
MTRWDYLRAFHARHPGLGAMEPIYLRYYNQSYKQSLKDRPKHANSDFYLGDANKLAADRAERGVLGDYRAGRIR